MKKILYVGNFSFPLGNAAGKRVYANGKVFKELNYEVIFIGLDKNIPFDERLEETKKEYDGFTYYNFPYPSNNFYWINYKSTFKSLVKFINNKFDSNELEMVVYYGSPSLSIFIYKLIKYCKANNIRIVSDCVDWLTVKTNNPIFNFIKWTDNTFQKAFLNKTVDGIIVISRYLDEYYKKENLKTVIIPPLSPDNSKEVNLSNSNYKIITYAGTPFRKGKVIKDLSTLKDRIDKVIAILTEVKNEGIEFEFHIYGFTKDEYLEVLPNQKNFLDILGTNIVFHGIMPNKYVTKEIAKSDYTVLFRDVNRDSCAGFPTKISESISFGTPVLTTKSSDLEHYIIEGYNGFYFDYNVTKENISKMTAVLSKHPNEIVIMKNNCIRDNLFYYKRYIKAMNSFVGSLENVNTKQRK